MKAFVIIIGFCIIFVFSCGSKKKDEGKVVQDEKYLMGKKILMIVPENDFNEDEYSQTKVTLEEEGATVKVASKQATFTLKGMEGLEVTSNLSWDTAQAKDWDAVVLIGGSGTPKHFDDTNLQALVKDFYAQKKWIASICLSPMILAKSGILIGKKATSFESIRVELKNMGVIVDPQKVVVDEDAKIITSDGPKSAMLFALKIIEKVGGKKSQQARDHE
jgi:protease I